MRIDCEWFDDPEQYVVLTYGTDTMLHKLIYDERVPIILLQDDLHIHEAHTSQLRIRKSTWFSFVSSDQNYIKAFCVGFSAGFDHGQYS